MNPYSDQIIKKRIQTKNKIRIINTYISDDCELRSKHSKIHSFINEFFEPSVFSKAYLKNTSIYSNAKAHLYNDYFIMLDVKNFFNSISHNVLKAKLYKELNKNEPNCINKSECNKIVEICSVAERGIPLGFITSPVLSNIYLREFDNIIYGKIRAIDELKNKRVIYTRYADDLFISFKWNSKEKATVIEEKIIDIIKNQLKRVFLRLNDKKTRSYNLNISNHVKITGVNISKDSDNNRTLTVGRKTKNDLFWDALKAYETHDSILINKVKGMQSFILSIEESAYDNTYSSRMNKIINDIGFSTLKELINSL